MAGEYARSLAAQQEFAKGLYELSTMREEAPAKRKEFKKRELAAQRDIDLAPELDKKAKLQVEDTIGKLEKSIGDTELEVIVRDIGDIPDQETYDIIYPKLPDTFKKSMKSTGNFKKDKSKIDYLTKKGMHNITQRRAIEMEAYKGLAKARGKTTPYTPPMKPQGFDTNIDLASIKSQLAVHPQFKTMAKGMLGTPIGADVFSSPEIMAITGQLANEANSLLSDSYNKAVEKRSHYVLNRKEALSLATDKQLARMHNSNPTVKGLVYLTPEESENQRQEWITARGSALASQVQGFDTLPAQQKMQFLNEMYEEHQMHSYLTKRDKTEGRTMYGD